jgi:hypothetical protein
MKKEFETLEKVRLKYRTFRGVVALVVMLPTVYLMIELREGGIEKSHAYFWFSFIMGALLIFDLIFSLITKEIYFRGPIFKLENQPHLFYSRLILTIFGIFVCSYGVMINA